ncbi:MAG: pseudouridine synthase [Bacillota bacterium]
MRLDAYISDAGVTSRRKARSLVEAGRVRIDGRPVFSPGYRLGGDETVEVDGRIITPPRERIHIALHKPSGYVTTTDDPRGRPTVMDLVPGEPRLFPVGRLDLNTSGLLLMTDDGPWSARLEHPGTSVPRTYWVCLLGRPDDRVLSDLRSGIPLADGVAKIEIEAFGRADDEKETCWKVTLREGRYREIRRLFATVGHPVLTLRRIGFGPVNLGDLPAGRWRHLKAWELREIERYIGTD